jgi:hypothetical protein
VGVTVGVDVGTATVACAWLSVGVGVAVGEGESKPSDGEKSARSTAPPPRISSAQIIHDGSLGLEALSM